MDKMMAAIIIKRAAKRFLKRKREGKIPPRTKNPKRNNLASGTGAQGSFMSDMGMSDAHFGDTAGGHIVNVPGNVDVHRTAV